MPSDLPCRASHHTTKEGGGRRRFLTARRAVRRVSEGLWRREGRRKVGIVVHAPGAGRLFGPGIAIKVDVGQGRDFAAFEVPLPPVWEGPPPHLHREYDEAFYVVDGTVTFWIDGATRD